MIEAVDGDALWDSTLAQGRLAGQVTKIACLQSCQGPFKGHACKMLGKHHIARVACHVQG